MCSIILGVEPGRFWLAANRDELLARPARGPFWWHQGFLAGRDEQAGGTWLGLNQRGLAVGVTNRFGAQRHPERGSRGALVVDALAQPSVTALHAWLGALSPGRCNAFHLVYADGARAGVTWSDGETLTQQLLGPGLHVVTERSYGAAEAERATRLREALGGVPTRPEASTLQRLLAVHDEANPLAASCVHLDAFGYGTRSSAILFPGERFLWAEGPPCVTPWQDLTGLLQSASAPAS